MTTPTPTTDGSAPGLRRVGLYATLVVLALIFVVPLLWMVITSFKTYTAAQQIPPSWLPNPLAGYGYEQLLDNSAEPGAALVPQQHARRHAAPVLVLVTASMAAYSAGPDGVPRARG